MLFVEAVTLTFTNEHNPDIYLGETVTLRCTQHITSGASLFIRHRNSSGRAGCHATDAGNPRPNRQHFNHLTYYGVSFAGNKDCKVEQENQFLEIVFRVQVTEKLNGSAFQCQLSPADGSWLKHSTDFTFNHLKGKCPL